MTKEQILDLVRTKIKGQGNQVDLGSALGEVIEALADNAGGATPITYSELKALRNDGKLVAGQQYRITDYHCTTAQPNTQSADHQFDIIVTADDEKTLNENARAVQREGSEVVYKVKNLGLDAAFARYADGDTIYEGTQYYAFDTTLDEETHLVLYATSENPNSGDEVYGDLEGTGEISVLPTTWIKTSNDYFASSNLAAWELKYSLDNDTERFAWAKPQEDMVITNDAAYYRRCPSKDQDGEYAYAFAPCMESEPYEFIEDGDDIVYVASPTPNVGDTTYHPNYEGGIYRDVASIERDGKGGSGVIYYMKDEFNNECPYDFKNIQFQRKLTDGAYDPTNGTDTFVYTFNAYNNYDGGIHDATLLNHIALDDAGCCCKNNIIREYNFEYVGAEYSKIRLNDIAFLNLYSFDDGQYFECYSNTFGNGCDSNTFGNNFYANTFGNYCGYNTFGNGCDSNTFGNDCDSNTFGNDCYSNTFGNYCDSNTFGNDCYSNTFGNYCYYNTFGNDCDSNTFGNDCYSNTFGNSSAINYCRYITFGDGVQYCKIYGTTTTSSSKYLQNIRIAQGLLGSSSSRISIDVAPGLEYETYVGKNSSGALVIKNLLD